MNWTVLVSLSFPSQGLGPLISPVQSVNSIPPAIVGLLLKHDKEDSLSTEITEKSGRQAGAASSHEATAQEELLWINVTAKEKSPQCKGARQSHDSMTWAPRSSRAYFSWISEPTNLILCLTRFSCIWVTQFKGPWWPCPSHNPDRGNISPKTSLHYNDLSHLIYAPFLFLITVISLPDLHIVWVPMPDKARHFIHSTLLVHTGGTSTASPPPWPVLICWRWTLVVCIPRVVSKREWRGLADCPAAARTDFLKSILRYGCLL